MLKTHRYDGYGYFCHMTIETHNLALRPINILDKEAVFAYRSDATTNQYQGWIPQTLEDVENFILKNPTSFNEAESWFQLVIIEKISNKTIGDIGVHFYGEENLQVELGCTIDRNHHKKGYATEALRGVINTLFILYKKHRITASIDPRNDASASLLERIGFRKEAHFRESLFLDGKWVDDVIYALLAKDWHNR